MNNITTSHHSSAGTDTAAAECSPAADAAGGRQSKARICFILFSEFFKIATFVVGGGFAILLVADDIFVHKYKWIHDGELADMLALIQTVPGLTAGNIAIYIGYRAAGAAGAFCALCGVAMPSFIVISIVAMVFDRIPVHNRFVSGAFLGVRTAMTGLTALTLVRIWKKAVSDPLQALVFAAGVIAVSVFHIGPGWLIGCGIIFGLLCAVLVIDRVEKAESDRKDG